MDAINDSPAAESGSLRSYVTGLVLALTLTAIPFRIVMHGGVTQVIATVSILTFALLQIVVHLTFFLHLYGSSTQRWNLVAFLMSAVIVVVLLGGSSWIMFHLRHNMMPMMGPG